LDSGSETESGVLFVSARWRIEGNLTTPLAMGGFGAYGVGSIGYGATVVTRLDIDTGATVTVEDNTVVYSNSFIDKASCDENCCGRGS
jgi:hypothetical protein